jgi:prophage regulatory protein
MTKNKSATPFYQTLKETRPEASFRATDTAATLVEANRAGQPPPRGGIRLLSYEDLKAKGIRFSRQWLVVLQRQGKFPRTVNLGAAHVGFVESEIDDWLEGLIRERDQAAQPAPAG